MHGQVFNYDDGIKFGYYIKYTRSQSATQICNSCQNYKVCQDSSYSQQSAKPPDFRPATTIFVRQLLLIALLLHVDHSSCSGYVANAQFGLLPHISGIPYNQWSELCFRSRFIFDTQYHHWAIQITRLSLQYRKDLIIIKYDLRDLNYLSVFLRCPTCANSCTSNVNFNRHRLYSHNNC